MEVQPSPRARVAPVVGRKPGHQPTLMQASKALPSARRGTKLASHVDILKVRFVKPRGHLPRWGNETWRLREPRDIVGNRKIVFRID
jgi:hypothetical protein